MNPLLEKIQTDLTAKIKPDDKQDFLNAVKAGRHILWDPKTHQNMQLIKNPESRKDPVNTVAQGIAGLGYIMYMQSNKQIKADVLIPAMMMLACDVLDFSEQAGWFSVDAQMVAAITKEMIAEVYKKLGVKPEDLKAAIEKGQAEINDAEQSQQPQQAEAMPQQEAGPGLLPTVGG